MDSVAPRAGAWIETQRCHQMRARISVAPRAGAWIETCSISLTAMRPEWSRPVRARGSKQFARVSWLEDPDSRAPCGRVDRNINPDDRIAIVRASRPVRARGSKPVSDNRRSADLHRRAPCGRVDRNVDSSSASIADRRGRAPCGRVDRNGSRARGLAAAVLGRAPCGRVDRNCTRSLDGHCGNSVAPRAGAWIETTYQDLCSTGQSVAPRAGAWIETSIASPIHDVERRAPCGRVD